MSGHALCDDVVHDQPGRAQPSVARAQVSSVSALFVIERALAALHEHDWKGAHMSVLLVWTHLGT